MDRFSPFAIITGASRGIGAAYASELAKRGYDLLLVARDFPRLNRIAEELHGQFGVTIEKIGLDLTERGTEAALFTHAKSLNRPISLVVQNAGFGLYGAFATMPQTKILEMVELHIRQITESTRWFLPELITQGQGTIIIVSSIAGFFPIPYMAEYAASKAYLNAFSEAVAHELEGTGVTIQVCCPGFTETDFHKTAGYRPRHALSPQSPHQVASESLNALQSPRTLVTIGWQGRLASWMAHLLPKKILLSLASRFVKPSSSGSFSPPTS